MRSTLSTFATIVALAFVLHPVHSAAQVSLDYEYYKARVEPIFLAKRDGHARCFVCHSDANNAFRLQKLPEKSHTGPTRNRARTSRMVSALVTPGNPDKSHLLMYPLAPEAGGSIYHSGGRQFRHEERPGMEDPWRRGSTGQHSSPVATRKYQPATLRQRSRTRNGGPDVGPPFSVSRIPSDRSGQRMTSVSMRFGTSPTGMTARTFLASTSMAVTDIAAALEM